jgi:hypothetical protein
MSFVSVETSLLASSSSTSGVDFVVNISDKNVSVVLGAIVHNRYIAYIATIVYAAYGDLIFSNKPYVNTTNVNSNPIHVKSHVRVVVAVVNAVANAWPIAIPNNIFCGVRRVLKFFIILW